LPVAASKTVAVDSGGRVGDESEQVSYGFSGQEFEAGAADFTGGELTAMRLFPSFV
jgi:hypothetical protein